MPQTYTNALSASAALSLLLAAWAAAPGAQAQQANRNQPQQTRKLVSQAVLPSYTYHNLGLVNDGSTSGSGVNNAGQVTGSILGSSNSAFLSEANGGTIHDLGRLGGSYSSGNGVNNSGQVVGTGALLSNASHALLSEANGGALHDLGTLGGLYSSGYGVNTTGQVTGSAATASGDSHAFLSDANGGSFHDLGTLGGSYSEGLSVNDKGQVTGDASTLGGNSDAFLSGINGGALRDLGSLGGGSSRGSGVNNAGQVVGSSTITINNPYTMHAFLSDPDGGALHDLGTLGGTFSSAQGINSTGQVVGIASAGDFSYRAFLFTGGRMLDLNTLLTNSPGGGVILSGADGISNTGFITGAVYDPATGKNSAFLLTPNMPVLTAAAAASAASNGTRQISITVTDNGAAGAMNVRVLGAALNGAVTSSSLPTAPAGLQPGQSQKTVLVFPASATGRAVLRVSGDYTDPTTGRTGQFGTTLRLSLP